MNPKEILLQLLSASIAINGLGASTPAVLLNSLTGGDRGSEILERGQDFAVVRAVTTTTDTAGRTNLRTNQFTLLENGLHYEANGHWEVSEDVVEPFPGGAIARRGPWKTIFSSDLNSSWTSI